MVQINNLLSSDKAEDPVVRLDAFRKAALSPEQEGNRKRDVDIVDVAKSKTDGRAVAIRRTYGDAAKEQTPSPYQAYIDRVRRTEVDARMNGDVNGEIDNPWDYTPSDWNG